MQQLRRPVHSKAISAFNALCLFHVLYKFFKAFLCLSVDAGKASIQFAPCKIHSVGLCLYRITVSFLFYFGG